MHIMLVEDEAPLRSSLETLLDMEGYNVVSAADAREARDAAERLEHPPDVLLTDIVLPDENGVELSKALGRRWPELRTIFISGYSAEVVDEYGEVQSDREMFLPKPIPPDRLIEALQSLDSSSS